MTTPENLFTASVTWQPGTNLSIVSSPRITHPGNHHSQNHKELGKCSEDMSCNHWSKNKAYSDRTAYSPSARLLAWRTRDGTRAFALGVSADLPAFGLATCRVLVRFGARFLTRMLAIQAFLTRMRSMFDPLYGASGGWRVIKRLTCIACCVAALATTRHQFSTANQTWVVFRVLRTRHLCLMFAIRQLLHYFFVASNAFELVQLVARVGLSVKRNSECVPSNVPRNGIFDVSAG